MATRSCESEGNRDGVTRATVSRSPGGCVGIDPGLNVTGYAVVDPAPRGPYVVEAGVIRPRLGVPRPWASGWTDPPGRLRGARRLSRPAPWRWSRSTAT